MDSDAKKILKIGSLSVLFIFIIIYAFFRSKDLILGVKIKNVNIDGLPPARAGGAQAGAKVTANVLKITGNAKHATMLSIDDREISIDQNGAFSESLALSPGYNIISIKAKDKFGHSDQKDYKLILAPN